MNIIKIERSALLNIVRSAYAVFPNETLGYLYGYIKISNEEKFYVVNNALPFQTVKRRRDKVWIDEKEGRRLLALNSDSLDEQFLGDYHSHTDGVISISRQDKESTEDNFVISLLASIRKRKRARPFSHSSIGICGDLDVNKDKLRFVIRGYYLEGDNLKIARLDIADEIVREVFRI